MSSGRRARRLIDIAGMAIALGTMFALENFWAGLLAANIIFVVTYAISEWAFPEIESAEETREDSEDRKNDGT